MRNAELWAHQWESSLAFVSTSRSKAHTQVRDRVRVAHELARGNLVGWAEFTDILLNQRAGTSPMLRQMVESLTQVGQRLDPDQYTDDAKLDKAKKFLANKEFYAQGIIDLSTALAHLFSALAENSEHISYALLDMDRDKPLLKELGWPKVPLSVEDSTGAGFIVHKQQLRSESITLRILSKRISRVGKCFEKASYRVHQFFQRLVKQKRLRLLQPGWNRMILPPDGDMWEGKLILGNPRRRIYVLTDIVKLCKEGVKQAHEAQRAFERHNLWGT